MVYIVCHLTRTSHPKLGISTAIKTPLKVAFYDCFDGPLVPLTKRQEAKVDHYNRTEQMMGPSVNIILLIIDKQLKKRGDYFHLTK